MRLTSVQARELLAKHGCYITEICDKCGRGIGTVCYTRAGDSGVWCSRECRGDEQRQTIRKGGRPRKYQTEAARRRAERQQNAQRQQAFRERARRNGKPSPTVAEIKELQVLKSPLSQYPSSQAFGGSTPA
jgi:hypothetical protein